MCGFCGARDVRDDVIAATTPVDRSPAYTRQRLAVAATGALAPHRVTVRSWSGRFIVSSATGRSVIVDRFADVVWAAASLANRQLDARDVLGDVAAYYSEERQP